MFEGKLVFTDKGISLRKNNISYCCRVISFYGRVLNQGLNKVLLRRTENRQGSPGPLRYVGDKSWWGVGSGSDGYGWDSKRKDNSVN